MALNDYQHVSPRDEIEWRVCRSLFLISYNCARGAISSIPDANGVELSWDRPHEKWPRAADGAVEMFTRSLNLDSLLAEAKIRSGK